jgi:TrmH family RNA methyltransferase
VITSTSNTYIKGVKKLKNRQHRTESGLGFIEGIRIVYEAINSEYRIEEVLFSPELAKSKIIEEALEKAREKNIRIIEVSSQVFESLSSKEGPQGLAAVIRQQWVTLERINTANGLWIALEEVADPGNLGTILRTCDAVGANGMILIGNCTDPYDSSALRASMGAIFSQNLIKTTEVEFISWIKTNNRYLIGTSDQAKIDYREIDYSVNTILLMGSERQGLSKELADTCSSIVSIPMKGSCDSLNLAVASAIMLYETTRQENKREI